MTKVSKTQVHSFHAHVDIKAVFTFLKEHIQERKHSQQKLPLVDPILMLLMTIDKSSEFGWICIDQRLNLVFKSCAILHRVPPNSSMVFTLSVDIILFQIYRFSRPCGNSRNPIILNQYGEQLCIRHWEWMIHFSPFPFLALVIAWVRPLIVFLCKALGRLKTDKRDSGMSW